MSPGERIRILLVVIAALGLVVYPLAYRITTGPATANAPLPPVATGPRPSTSPAPTRILATPRIAPTPPAPTLSLDELSWLAEAMEHRGENGTSFEYECSPDGTFGQIWGTDTYTDDSSVCTAGVHQGVITRELGGTVTIIVRPGLDEYVGSRRNGVTTEPYEAWDGSYVVVEP